MNTSWNIPLNIIIIMKNILNININNNITFEKLLSNLRDRNLEENDTNRTLLNKCLDLVKDTNKHYHIMKIEDLLKSDSEEFNILPLSEKINSVYKNVNFNNYLELYENDLNKKKLLLIESIKYVTSLQFGDLTILKYTPEVTYYNLWNEFYMECRGIIIDIKNNELVSCPYRKFHNLNEIEETSLDNINKLLKDAIKLSIKNKEDGSMISVSKYKNEIIVATPGSLKSNQALWAKEFLNTNNNIFLDNIEDNLTYLFEAIYPENQIVVNYNGEEKLILTNIRNKENGKYLSDEEVEILAEKYGFHTPIKETKAFNIILDESKNRDIYPSSEKEGWVIFIITKDKELMFKLKCDDYCIIHKLVTSFTSPKLIFQNIINESYDDFISKVPETIKKRVETIATIIFEYRKNIMNDLNMNLQLIPPEIMYDSIELDIHEEFKKTVEELMLNIINEKLSKNLKTELKNSLYLKAYGKEPLINKYYIKHFNLLWDMLPENLRNQREFKKKEGKLLGFVNKNISDKYRPVALNFARGLYVDLNELLNLNEINFSYLNNSDD